MYIYLYAHVYLYLSVTLLSEYNNWNFNLSYVREKEATAQTFKEQLPHLPYACPG